MAEILWPCRNLMGKEWLKGEYNFNWRCYVPPDVYSSLTEIQIDKNNCFLFNTNEAFVLPLLTAEISADVRFEKFTMFLFSLLLSMFLNGKKKKKKSTNWKCDFKCFMSFSPIDLIFKHLCDCLCLRLSKL